ncbi:T-cell immunoglobulin and mucin domain-containing protein 4-like [Engystomops pustulosus]|uniref:T-cell immunoglobulin and mucin domain-containing protein 4-like n=1 Tax=Engystomops pustulosus TaxID=76066 RepID=UPI003AFAC104
MVVGLGWVLCLVLSITAMTSSDTVTGLVDDVLTLPCSYTTANSGYHMCWGRGGCPNSKCNDEILKTDGNRVTWRKSERYQLLGDITQGDVSMTIAGATKEDQGVYCCRVEIPGPFNDLKKNVKVEIQEVDLPVDIPECPNDMY